MADFLDLRGYGYVRTAFLKEYSNVDLEISEDLCSGTYAFRLTDKVTGRYAIAKINNHTAYGAKDEYYLEIFRSLGNKLEYERKRDGLDPRTGIKLFGGREATSMWEDEDEDIDYYKSVFARINNKETSPGSFLREPTKAPVAPKVDNSKIYSRLNNYGRY